MPDGFLARRFGVYNIEREVDLDEFLAIFGCVWHGFIRENRDRSAKFNALIGNYQLRR